MKFKFLKKAVAFVTAAAMAVGTLAVLPEEYLPEFGIVASAEDTQAILFSTGDGSKENPFRIETAAQLSAVRNNMSANYIQVADIDLSAFSNWEPIGKQDEPFSGTYNGNGHTISNLQITDVTEGRIGLFGYVQNGNITNISLIGTNISINEPGRQLNVGAICGVMNNSIISDCTVSGIINIISTNYRTVASGIVGTITSSELASVKRCKNYSSINVEVGATPTCYAAGICGFLNPSNKSNVIISGCSNYGSISSYSPENMCYAAGICGYTSSYGGSIINIEKCSNHGDLTTTTGKQGYSAGITAYCDAFQNNSCTYVSNCYNSGEVIGRTVGGIGGRTYIGALPGYSAGRKVLFSNCYNVGSVSVEESLTVNTYIGSLLGSNYKCSVENCYYLDSTGTSSDGKALSSSQLQTASELAGFDFNNVWEYSTTGYLYPVFKSDASESDDESTIVSGRCGNNAYWALSTDGVLTISGTGSLYGYSSYSNFGGEDFTTAPWWVLKERITKIVVKSGITKITEYAFMNMHYVEEIYFEDGIKTISGYNFCCNNALTKITIPKSVTGIGSLCCWKGGTNSELTIYGYSGSVAETYAKNNNLKFVDLALEEKGYIKLSPLNEEGIPVGGGESILAYVYDKDDNRLSNVNLVWTSSDDNIVAITESNNLGAVVKGIIPGSATITCTDIVSGIVGIIRINVNRYSIKYSSQEQNKELVFDYSDSYFENDAHVYNQKLAQASLALELSSFTTYGNENWITTANVNREQNLYDAFITLGFAKESIEFKNYNYALSDASDKVAFGVANKQITSSDGKTSTLVAIAVRGGGYGAEWASNFRIGNNEKYASGFWNSSTGVYAYINEYIDNLRISKENVKIWIVGFSRGAAVANLTAARLCQIYNSNNVFAYTFATPQGYVFEENEINNNISYSNIHNIINPADLVPTVALSDWNFGRFGSSHYIKNQYDAKMNQIYVELMGEPYDFNSQYPAKVYELNDFLLNFLAHDTNIYTNNLQNIIVQVLKDANSEKDMAKGGINSLALKIITQYIVDNAMPYQVEAKNSNIIVTVQNWMNQQFSGELPSSMETVARLYTISNIADIFKQHYPEVYISWLFSTDENNKIFGKHRYKSAIIDCPVDVYVYDGNGTLVTSIVNNEIKKDDVNAAVFGDQKRVYLYGDAYTIKLVGNNTGTMNYSIEEHDSDGRMTRRVSYYDLPLENGKTYTGVVNDEVDTPSYNYDLSSDDGNHSSNFDTNDSTDNAHNIIINGGLSSVPSAYPGEQVTITALVPNDNSTFSKWATTSSVAFNNAQTPVATFIMPNEDVEITAVNSNTSSKLSSILVDSTAIDDFSADNTAYTVTLPYGTTAIPTVTATPANANADVDITQATSLTGTESERTAIITVTAEDGVTKTIYKVVFSIETHTHNLATEYSSDATGHWYACSGCDEKVDFEAHTEDSGTVTTEPTETTEGVKTFKCTKCDWIIRTEPITVLDHTHTLATEYSSDSTGHWYACSGCDEKVAFEAHTEDGGTVTTVPTETTEGVTTFKCTKCKFVLRTEPIPPITPDHIHNYDAEWKSDSTSHWHECSCGEKTEVAAHISNNGVVTVQPTETSEGIITYSCSVCEYILRTETIPPITPEHTHEYGTEWKTDSTSHWYECTCGEKADIAAHISDNGVVTLQPTETSEGIMTYSCSVCDYILRTETTPSIVPDHTHNYGTEWKSDSTSHWHECACGDKTDITQHITNGGIVTVQPTATSTGLRVYSCSVCGYVLRTETIPATGYNYPSYPTYPTYPFDSSIFNVVTFTDKVNVTAETNENTITLKWDKVEKADKYYVYQYKNGKYVKVKTTSDTSATF
ncbi:MAG: leucine-rich repeat protein, partial [Huintestinicola sp.]